MPRRKRSKPSGVPSSRNIYQALVGLVETRGQKKAARALGVSVSQLRKATSKKGRKAPAKVLRNPAKWNERLGDVFKKQEKTQKARQRKADDQEFREATTPRPRRVEAPRYDVEEEEEEEPQVNVMQWKENEAGVVSPGDEAYGDAIRFVRPGVQWDGSRPMIEYRGSVAGKDEAIAYITEINRSSHVLVVVEFDDGHCEIWLDYEDTKK